MNRRVNLLPWRARRVKRQRRRALMLSTLLIAIVLATGSVWRHSLHKAWRMSVRDNQKERLQLTQVTRQLSLKRSELQRLEVQAEHEERARRRLRHITGLSSTLQQTVALLPPQVWLTRILATEKGIRLEGKVRIKAQLRLWLARIEKRGVTGPILTSLSDGPQGESRFTLDIKEKSGES